MHRELKDSHPLKWYEEEVSFEVRQKLRHYLEDGMILGEAIDKIMNKLNIKGADDA